MNPILKQIHPSWEPLFKKEIQTEYFKKLHNYLDSEKKNHAVFPPENEIFHAFEVVSLQKLKVVILGQDPYHGKGEAHGLSFSVKPHVKVPPSLKNIYKEIKDDLDIEPPNHGYLESWARQGVMLLNTTLTVRKDSPGSHQKKGWENFTDKAIEFISAQKKHVVFFLWGNHAKQKEPLINNKQHLVLKAAHPSPFSARSGFFGCRHFSKANEYLSYHNNIPIDWSLPELKQKQQ